MTSLLAAPGCGGGSSPIASPGTGTSIPAMRRGQVRFTIKWPEKATPTRLIPQVAQSLKFRCLDADDEDEVISEVVVPRGQSIVTLELPSVHVKIDAAAHANGDGSGQVLAKGDVTVLVKEAQVTSEKLTLDSVITEVKLSQDTVTLQPDSPVAVSANAYDETGAVVLTDPEGWEWTPDDATAGTIVEFRPTGYLLSLAARQSGSASFTVREKETGKTARLAVTSHASTPSPSPTPTPSPSPTPDSRPRVTARVDPGPNGEYRALEIYVADTQLVGFCDSNMGSIDIPFELTLAPGKYYIWVKDVSGDSSPWYYVDFAVSISGITGLSGSCYKNDYRADIFYIK
jgi:hypothetical protein